ncbi:MAG: NAD(P)-dependent oxidoreductase [Spirochaetales bacterium]
MKITFLDAASLGPGLDFSAFERWGVAEFYDNTALSERAARLHDTTVAIANRVVFDEAVFLACPQLKLILLTATGYNNVDLDAARKYRVGVCNVVGYSTASVAQHTFALLLALMEQTSWLDAYAKSHWAGSTTFGHLQRPFHEIEGKRWGIIGLGAIGRRVAGLAQAFGAEPVYFSTTDQDRAGSWPRLQLETLLATSDIVSIHSPLNDRTRGLLGVKELGWMRASAYLVNVGRGGIVDERALALALDRGELAGAALDVTLPEPPLADNPLLRLKRPERLVISPHLAWASVEARNRCLVEVGLNLQAWLDGERRNRLD